MSKSSQFTLGVVEGFYGVFYTFPERLDLIRFLGQHGYNKYIYAPKNDRQHRARWWEPYPERIMAEFAQTVSAAKEVGVDFCYAISPGGTMEYRSPVDYARITAKLKSFFDLGVRSFMLMLDDNEQGLRHAADSKLFGSLPKAQASLANRLYKWLQTLDSACTLCYVPAEYSRQAPFSSALVELARLLHPEIDLCYTGPEVCSPTITVEDVHQFARATGRKPLIWDNYPVNDLSMQPELHLAPYTGREAAILEEVSGILVNPMLQAEASKIPLLTIAAFYNNPGKYRPQRAWDKALRQIAGADYAAPLRLLAENTEISCLGKNGQKLDALAAATVADLKECKLESLAIRQLEDYLTEIDDSTYILKFRLENLALRANLLPWIDILEHWMWIARFSLKVLRNIQQGKPYNSDLLRITEYQAAIRSHSKRIASKALEPLVAFALKQAEQDQHQKVHQNRNFLFHRALISEKQKDEQSFVPFLFWRQK